MEKLTVLALAILGTAPCIAHASEIYGSVSYLTARSCSSVTAADACDGSGPGQHPPIADQISGGPSSTASSSLNLADGSSAFGSVNFGAYDLPVIKASSISSASDRMNSNDLGYQAYTYTGTTPVELSYTADLHIDDSTSDGSTGVYPNGAIYTDYVAIWDPSIVSSVTSPADILENFFYAPCGTPGVLAVGSEGGALNGGEANFTVATTSCSGTPVTLSPGQQILAVAGIQIPTNRGGSVDATHTFTMAYDPALGAATVANLEQNLVSAESVSAAPEPSTRALMT